LEPRCFGEPLAAAAAEMNGEVECSVCHAKVPVPPAVSKAYDSHRSTVSSRQRALNVLLVSGDCVLAGLQVKAAIPATFSRCAQCLSESLKCCIGIVEL
jgi:hypothetical protein